MNKILIIIVSIMGLFAQGDALASPKLKPIDLLMPKNIKLEFMPCPAGSFMMGKEDDNDTNSCTMAHKVTITRPFWLTKFKVTHEQWNLISKPVIDLNEKDKSKKFTMKDIYGKTPVSKVSYKSIMEFYKHLQRRYKARLPKGYVIRLPTEAEWEYALLANSSDFEDPYVVYLNGSYVEKMEAAKSITVQWDDWEKWNSKFGRITEEFDEEKKKNIMKRALIPVGTKKPNRWGLYDMIGNGCEIMLDTVCQLQKRKDDRDSCIYPVRWGNRLTYSNEEQDPLKFFKGESIACVARGKSYGWGKTCPYEKLSYPIWSNYEKSFTFRLCIGPDLVAENKAQLKKK